jgi:hypothetical protein
MGVFDYNSFADLSLIFDTRKGRIVIPTPKARVILYSTTALKSELAQSKFIDLGAFMPTVKPRFLTVSAKMIKPVVVEVAPAVVQTAIVQTVVLQPAVLQPAVLQTETAAEEPKKGRSILKLKTKVELPVMQTLSRRSTAQDMAAVFKAEMALMEKKAVQEPSRKLEDAFTKRRRHPLSHKPWSELLAEVETPRQSKNNNFDLATAFKAEMKAFMAAQEKLGEDSTPAKFKTAAEHKTVSPQPQQAPAQRRPSLAA